MSAIRFCVPIRPLGVNRAYAPARWGKRHGFRKTEEANDYAVRIQMAARRAMRGRDLLTGNCEVRFRFVYPDRRSDIDGAIKGTMDALEGFVLENDRQVIRLVVDKERDPEAPRVEIEVFEVTP